jgi:hypothetical protein
MNLKRTNKHKRLITTEGLFAINNLMHQTKGKISASLSHLYLRKEIQSQNILGV